MCRLIAIVHDTRLPFIPTFAIPLWARVKGSRRDWAFRLRRHALHSPSWCRRNSIIRKLITWRLPLSLQGFYLYLYIGSMIFLLFMYATMFWGSSAPITSKSFAHTAFDALALSCEKFLFQSMFAHRLEKENGRRNDIFYVNPSILRECES